jgi:hypothetical protein
LREGEGAGVWAKPARLNAARAKRNLCMATVYRSAV